MAAGKAEEALAHYDKAVAKLPAEAGVHFDRGAALYALSRFDEAAQEFLRATDGQDAALKAEAFRGLGNAHFKKEKFKDAVEAYKRALALRPDDQAAKRNLELALLKKKEEEKKEQDNKDKDKDKDKQDKQDDKDKKDDQSKTGQGQGQAGQEGRARQEGQGQEGRPEAGPGRQGQDKKDKQDQQQPKPAGEDKAQQLEALLEEPGRQPQGPREGTGAAARGTPRAPGAGLVMMRPRRLRILLALVVGRGRELAGRRRRGVVHRGDRSRGAWRPSSRSSTR